jgi:hypothetical protein
MSHHFDYPTDETLDISDAYCFAGAGDRHGPRTVFGMNTSPFGAPAWNAEGYYELRSTSRSAPPSRSAPTAPSTCEWNS